MKIRRAATRLRVLVLVVMALVAVSVLLVWTGAQIGFARVEMRGHGAQAIDPRVTGTISMLLAEVAMLKLVQMLGGIARGDAFGLRVIGHFRGFAFWLMLMSLAELFIPPISALVQRPPSGNLELRLDFSTLFMVGVTFLLFLLARLLERARVIEEENREIV